MSHVLKFTPKGRPFIMCEVLLHIDGNGVYQDLALIIQAGTRECAVELG